MALPDYQCVLAPDGLTWHLTQVQSEPLPITVSGGFTMCALWCEFRRGYERRRPTCAECLDACVKHEKRMSVQARTPRRLR